MAVAEGEATVPISWYAVLTAGSSDIKAYLDRFELMKDPQLRPLEQDGKQFGKLTYSGFSRYTDYEDVLNETSELISFLTGALRISHDPVAISIVNIVVVFEDGREKRFPPHGKPRLVITLGAPMRKPGVKPWPTAEQFVVEYAVRSANPLVKEVLRCMSGSPDFFSLFKILEVIRWDLGKGDMQKGYRLVWERGWVTADKLKNFSFTANKAYRHWDEKSPAPKMDIKEARAMFGRIVKGWIAEKAGSPMPP